MASNGYPHGYYFEHRIELVEKDESLSPEEKAKCIEKLQALATTPKEKWSLRNFLDNEELVNSPYRPQEGEEPSQLSKDISDYTPNYFMAPHTYNPEYHFAKKRFITGPFHMPDLLAFHLTVERLMENEEVSEALLDKDGEELLLCAAKMVVGGVKSFHAALFWLSSEMDSMRKSMRKGYMTTASYIGCPHTPSPWAIERAGELRENGQMPEKLYSGYEPGIEEAFKTMKKQRWNEALDAFVCIENGGSRPDWVPENYLELNQWTDPAKVEEFNLIDCVTYRYFSEEAHAYFHDSTAMSCEIDRLKYLQEKECGPSTSSQTAPIYLPPPVITSHHV